MKVGGTCWAFSCFFLSLSLLHCSQAGSVKYLVLFYPPACRQFQAVLLSFTMCHTIHNMRMHISCQTHTFYSSRLVQTEADPSVETCCFLQAHLCIISLNFMYHKTVIIAESIMLPFSIFLSLVSRNGVVLPLQPYCLLHVLILTGSCWLSPRSGCTDGAFSHGSPQRWTRLRQNVWQHSAPLLSIGLLMTVHDLNPSGVISVSMLLIGQHVCALP